MPVVFQTFFHTIRVFWYGNFDNPLTKRNDHKGQTLMASVLLIKVRPKCLHQ